MAYREEDDEARRAQFEAEKAALEARIAELEAENAALLTGERAVETLFGAKLTVVATATRRGVLENRTMRQLLRYTDPIVGAVGKQSFGEGVAVWQSSERDLAVVLRQEGDSTTIRVAERIGLVTGAMVGGVLGGGGGVAVLMALLWLMASNREPVVLLAIPIWLLIMYGVARFLLWRHVRVRQRKVDDVARRLGERARGTLVGDTELEKPAAPDR